MIDVKGKNVFLSGPMEGVRNNNAAAFADAHAALKLAGAARVYDPALMWLDCEGEHDHAHWMRRCLRELAIGGGKPYYDLLVSLPGWETSDGAQVERIAARACGVTVCEWAEVVECDT